MSHFTLLVTVDGEVEEAKLEAAVAELLEPFNENKAVPMYVQYTKQQLIDNERKEIEHYRDTTYAEYLEDPFGYAAKYNRYSPRHVDYLQRPAHIHEDVFAEGVSYNFKDKLKALEDEEMLYKFATEWYEEDEINAEGGVNSTYNPQSQWDWWVIGGRWDKKLNKTVPDNAEGWDGVNYIRRSDLVTELSPTFAFLTKEGVWNERGEMLMFGIAKDEKDTDVWAQTFADNLALTESNDWLVLVDCHI